MAGGIFERDPSTPGKRPDLGYFAPSLGCLRDTYPAYPFSRLLLHGIRRQEASPGQAAALCVRPLVATRPRFSAVGGFPGQARVRGVRAPFRPERIAQPGQREPPASPRRWSACGSSPPRESTGRDGEQAGRPARQDAGANVAMPNSRPPSIYPRNPPANKPPGWRRGSSRRRTPADHPQDALHKRRRLGRQHRQDEGLGEDKGQWSAQQRLNRR